MAAIKGILILSPFFSPNIGGVESHLDDLVNEINRAHIDSYVLTYSPLTTKSNYLPLEKKGLCKITRYKWFGYQIFPKLEKYPLFDFLYITPYLFFRSLIWMCFNKNKISIVHSHGFNAAFIGNILAKLFNKKHICSTHAVYENINGLPQNLTVKVLSHCDQILCLSKASIHQLQKWGIKPNKLELYRYWINLDSFTPSTTPPKKFTVLFVGRLIAKKGIRVFLKVAANFPNLKFVIAGNGPLENEVSLFSKKHPNVEFLGAIKNTHLPLIYQKASLFCIASQYPEGYGRVMMEAVASGVPVIGSNLGAIPEALNDSVSVLFKPTTTNFIRSINQLSKNSQLLNKMKRNCRPYAQNKFSKINFETILKAYQKLLDKDQFPDAV